jgi:hypothetical protein
MACAFTAISSVLLALLLRGHTHATKEQPPTPAEQYQALVKEAEKAQQEFFKTLNELGADERTKQLKDKLPKFAPKFLALAEKYPKDQAALDALIWVTKDFLGREDEREVTLSKATAILLRDHLESPKLGEVCEALSQQLTGAKQGVFFTAVMEKSPHKEVQAEACLALVNGQLMRALMAAELQKDPASLKQVEDAYGKEFAKALQGENVDRWKAQAEKNFARFAENYSGILSARRLARFTQLLTFRPDNLNEKILRTLLEKDARREVQGGVTLELGKLLRERADNLQDQQAKEAAKLYAESEHLLEKAADRFGDLELPTGKLGILAEKELFTLRFLTVGKVAPDIQGEDQLAKRFSLSDYKGKVVLLDFWSQY